MNLVHTRPAGRFGERDLRHLVHLPIESGAQRAVVALSRVEAEHFVALLADQWRGVREPLLHPTVGTENPQVAVQHADAVVHRVEELREQAFVPGPRGGPIGPVGLERFDIPESGPEPRNLGRQFLVELPVFVHGLLLGRDAGLPCRFGLVADATRLSRPYVCRSAAVRRWQPECAQGPGRRLLRRRHWRAAAEHRIRWRLTAQRFLHHVPRRQAVFGAWFQHQDDQAPERLVDRHDQRPGRYLSSALSHEPEIVRALCP